MNVLKSAWIGAAVVFGCWLCRDAAGAGASVGVSNSWLECAVRDLTSSTVVRLAPPGGCPGHFDLKPADVQKLATVDVLFYFDFQKGLEDRCAAFKNMKLCSVSVPEGLASPAVYALGCRKVADALAAAHPQDSQLSATLSARVEELGKRQDQLLAQGIERLSAAGLRGRRVVCSGRQTAFCKALGLVVTGEFSGPNAMTPAQLMAQVSSEKPDFVVGNVQEGDGVPATLSAYWNVPSVMLSNFPEMTPGESTFEAFFERNLQALLGQSGALK